MKAYFSDYFEVQPSIIETYGAFNISLIADLPLFIDPFLLFNSRKGEYQELHNEIIKYLIFLRDKSAAQRLDPGLVNAWFRFPEVRQNWFGFSVESNRGSGLGKDFAIALHRNLNEVFSNFGNEKITKGSHLEKLCLIKDGVGRDNISDFTTNLIRGFLLSYTQAFAQQNIKASLRREVAVEKVRFNYETESWERDSFDLPWFNDDYVLLTPRDMLTRDNIWINRNDLIDEFDQIPQAIPNDQLRAEINNYFGKILPKNPKKKDITHAIIQTIRQFPQLIDGYIRYKENDGERAIRISSKKVTESKKMYFEQFKQLGELLEQNTPFYRVSGKTYDDARQRALFLKDVIENKGGHRIFYIDGKPIEREKDLHILYRLTWYASSSAVHREVDDGRGPADFVVTKGREDQTVVEFKLAKNPQLERNLVHQVEIYKKASDAKRELTIILYFSLSELNRINAILKRLNLIENKNIILIDAIKDNKPSGSKA